MAVRRFQVRAPAKGWGNPGPDLLRTSIHAQEQVLTLLTPNTGPFYLYRDGLRGRELGTRHDVALELPGLMAKLGERDVIRIGTRDQVRAICMARVVAVPTLADCTAAAELDNGLVQTHFVGVDLAGCFACKDVANNSPARPGIPWSDHAWGDAVDETPRASGPTTNDDLFDWCVRMAASGDLPAQMVLGSRRGDVVNALQSNAWRIEVGGADSSHLWHVHISARRHTGVPPCAGG